MALICSRLLLQMINLHITKPHGHLPTLELCYCGPSGKLTPKHGPSKGQRASKELHLNLLTPEQVLDLAYWANLNLSILFAMLISCIVVANNNPKETLPYIPIDFFFFQDTVSCFASQISSVVKVAAGKSQQIIINHLEDGCEKECTDAERNEAADGPAQPVDTALQAHHLNRFL